MIPDQNNLVYCKSKKTWMLTVITESGTVLIAVSRSQALSLIEADIAYQIVE